DRATCKLLLGRLDQGWADYEKRWQLPTYLPRLPANSAPSWNRENLEGRSLLVFDEQGLGDTIQFARYLPVLAARGAQVTFRVQRKLFGILKGLSGPVRLVESVDSGSRFDAQCALMSLPQRLRTTLSDIPATVPYLSADSERTAQWRQRIGQQGFKIGIC